MMSRSRSAYAFLAALVAAVPACAQPTQPPAGPGYETMGPHVLMTSRQPATADDTARAWEQVELLRGELERFRDYDYAVEQGFRPFAENVPQPEIHVTSYRNALGAGFGFDPERPTSLLYERSGGEYELVGVMYTAPASADLDELDSRAPLSLGQWHLHTNICLPPEGQRARPRDVIGPNARFGTRGSIATLDACNAAGGRFLPTLFGWMLHVYPYEDTLATIYQPPACHRDGDMGEMMDHSQHAH